MRTQAVFIPGSIEEQGGKTMELVITDRRMYYAVKRVMDILIAGLLLIVTLPIMTLAAILIFIYSPGPIFFIQERVGAKRSTRGRTTTWQPTRFRCFKFRTMRINADSSVHQAYVRA